MRPRWPGRSTIWLRPKLVTPSSRRSGTNRSSVSGSSAAKLTPDSMADMMRRPRSPTSSGVSPPWWPLKRSWRDGMACSHAIRPGAGSTQTSASRAVRRGPASGKSSAASRTCARSPSRARQLAPRPSRGRRRAGSSRARSPRARSAGARATAARARRGSRPPADADLAVVGGHEQQRVAHGPPGRPAPRARPRRTPRSPARADGPRRRSRPSRGTSGRAVSPSCEHRVLERLERHTLGAGQRRGAVGRPAQIAAGCSASDGTSSCSKNVGPGTSTLRIERQRPIRRRRTAAAARSRPARARRSATRTARAPSTGSPV